MERIGMQWQVWRGRFANLPGFCYRYCWYVRFLSCEHCRPLFQVSFRAHLFYRGLGQRQGLMDCSRVVLDEHSSSFPDPCRSSDRSLSRIYPYCHHNVPGRPSLIIPLQYSRSNVWSCAPFASAGRPSFRIASIRRRLPKSSSVHSRPGSILIIRMLWIWNFLPPYVLSAFCGWHIQKLWMWQCLSDLKNLQQTNIPIYSFEKHQRLEETQYLYGATIIIGITTLVYFPCGPSAVPLIVYLSGGHHGAS